MSNRPIFRHAQSGFALGMILVVIALIAVISASLTLTGSDTIAHLSQDRLRSDALIIKSHGAILRDAVKNIQRIHGETNVDYSYACTGDRCLRTKVQLNKMPGEIFSPVPADPYGYKYWAASGPAVFASYNLLIMAMKHSIKPEICSIIESVNRSRTVSISEIKEASNFTVAGGGAGEFFLAQFNWDPVSQDGCFKLETDAVNHTYQYYYYIVVGRAN